MSAAVAVGVFDGLHLGHQRILARARERAQARGARTIVVSFDPHPDVVLSSPFRALPPLTPHTERRARMAALGIDHYEVLPFTRELAATEPETFVERHLIAPFAMRDLVVGQSFALGRKRAGNVPRLREIGAARGFEVEEVPLLEIGGAPVSSTRIRELLASGRVEGLPELLGRRYGLGGRVVRGEQIGRTLGVPTANLQLHEEKLIPADGIYAVWAGIDGEPVRRPGAMSIGVRPTFGGERRTLEVHLLDWSGELVDREVEVEFANWLRPEIKFDGIEALKRAMQDDLARARELLGGAPQKA